MSGARPGPGGGQTRVRSGSDPGQAGVRPWWPWWPEQSWLLEAGAELVRRDRPLPETVRARDAVANGAQDRLGRVGERADDLRPLDQELRRHRRRKDREVGLLVAL